MATKSTSKSPASQGKSGQSITTKQSSAPGKGGLNVTSIVKSAATGPNVMAGKGPTSGPRVTVANKGTNLSAADLVRGGYGAYQSPALNKQKAVAAYTGPTHKVLSPLGPVSNGLAGYEAFRKAIDQSGPRMSNIVAGDVAKYAVDGRSLNPMGEMFRAAVDRKATDAPTAIASYTPQKFKNKDTSRVAMTEPRGPALGGTYFAPQSRPTFAAGNYFPPSGPSASQKALAGLNKGIAGYVGGLANTGMFGGSAMAGADTLGPDYDTGWKGPQSGPETMPDPTGGPVMQPGQKYNVADSFTGNTNPAQERKPIPSWAEKIPGGLGMAASGLNWMSNLPGDGPDRRISNTLTDRIPETIWDGNRSSSQLAMMQPQTATGAPNPVAAAAAKPVGMTYPKYLYPDYTQGWANLPKGPYGRG